MNNLLADDWHMHLVHQYFKVFLIFPFLRNLILVKFFNFVSSYQIYREATTDKSNRCLGVLIAPLWRRRRKFKILEKLIHCKEFLYYDNGRAPTVMWGLKVYFRAYRVSLDILSPSSIKAFCILINNHTFYWIAVTSYQIYRRVTTVKVTDVSVSSLYHCEGDWGLRYTAQCKAGAWNITLTKVIVMVTLSVNSSESKYHV